MRNTIQRSLAQGIELHDLYDACDDIYSRVGNVSEKFNMLIDLCEKTGNKILEQTQTM